MGDEASSSSAVGARIEAPRGWGVGIGSSLLTGKGSGEGLCPLPRKKFDFGSQIGLGELYGANWMLFVQFT